MPEDHPAHLESFSRKERLAFLRENDIRGSEDVFGLFEIGLFDWHLKDCEENYCKMLREEGELIAEATEKNLHYNDSGLIAVEYYAKRTRYSHIVHLVTLLEVYLGKACSTIVDDLGSQDIPFSPDDLKGPKWISRLKFLKAYAKIEVPSDKQKSIDILHDIRNCIAHDGGCPNSKLTERMDKVEGLKVQDGELFVTKAYLESIFEDVKGIAYEVASKIDNLRSKGIRPELR